MITTICTEISSATLVDAMLSVNGSMYVVIACTDANVFGCDEHSHAQINTIFGTNFDVISRPVIDD